MLVPDELGWTKAISSNGTARVKAWRILVPAAEPYEVSCRSGENAKESAASTANSSGGLITRAVWREDGSIISSSICGGTSGRAH